MKITIANGRRAISKPKGPDFSRYHVSAFIKAVGQVKKQHEKITKIVDKNKMEKKIVKQNNNHTKSQQKIKKRNNRKKRANKRSAAAEIPDLDATIARMAFLHM